MVTIRNLWWLDENGQCETLCLSYILSSQPPDVGPGRGPVCSSDEDREESMQNRAAAFAAGSIQVERFWGACRSVTESQAGGKDRSHAASAQTRHPLEDHVKPCVSNST